MKTTNMISARKKMVEAQIVARGVKDPLVLNAMRNVPREQFIPVDLRQIAYKDRPLPIAANQTISQPYVVAFMIESLALRGGEKVLEIGAGSGYAAALLGEIAGEVYTVERIEELAIGAAQTLNELGYHNVHVIHGDGTLGWPQQAPYDAIIVAAGGPSVPQSLKSQLKLNGRMVIPVGTSYHNQELIKITRVSETQFKTSSIANVRFVPLVGDEGWKDSDEPPVEMDSRELTVDKPNVDDESNIVTQANISENTGGLAN